MTYKTANDCTYREMMDRFNSEINRAIQHDWHPDIVDRHMENRSAFMAKYREMQPGETIQQFEKRTRGPE